MQNNKQTRTELIDFMQQHISDTFEKMWPLAAIWLEKPVLTSLEKKRRITANDLVTIENGSLVDCNGSPTHKIKMLHGTMANHQFSITVENLITNEISIIKL